MNTPYSPMASDVVTLGKRFVRRLYFEPWLHDLATRVFPGALLVFGAVASIMGWSFTMDLFGVLISWFLIPIGILVTSLLGMCIQAAARAVRYAAPLQPMGWTSYGWLQTVESDFENRATLAVRRLAFRRRIVSQFASGVGAALALLVLLAAIRFIWVSVDCPLIISVPAFIGAILLIGVSRVVHLRAHAGWHRTVLSVVSQRAATPSLLPIALGQQGTGQDDLDYEGSNYGEVRRVALENPYYNGCWGLGGNLPLPVYRVTLGSVLRGILPWGKSHQFTAAAARTATSRADLRPGTDGLGYRKLLHPNGVCLFGTWEITERTSYTGFFQEGSKGLLVGRYSTCCTETRRGRRRSLSLVGRIYPTTNPNHTDRLGTANFITQEDLGGNRHEAINDAAFRNAPDVSAWRRGLLSLDGLPVLALTGIVFRLVDVEEGIRQLYEIAELGKPADQPTRAPKFMRISVAEDQPRIGGDDDLDFRDEVLAQIYDHGDPVAKRRLVFNIEVSDDEGSVRGPAFFLRRTIDGWQKIGELVFDEAVASYNGDHVLHFPHPRWRRDRNDPDSAVN